MTSILRDECNEPKMWETGELIHLLEKISGTEKAFLCLYCFDDWRLTESSTILATALIVILWYSSRFFWSIKLLCMGD